MTIPTSYGQPLVQPDDVVSRIDALIPADEVHSHPLVWRARNIDLALLIDVRNEIRRLRAGGCARNQGLTQHCAEAAAAHAEIERLRNLVAGLERDADRTRSRAKLADRDRRERIATACLAGLLADQNMDGFHFAADAAVKFADALIARLDKEATP